MIRLGRISYVNMAPVFFRLDAEVEEVQGVPTDLNRRLVAGEIDLAPISAEITYGLERLTMFLSRKSSVFDIEWGAGFGYGPVRKQDEYEFSRYYFEVADIDTHWTLLDIYEKEAKRCLEEKLVLPAYDWTLKCSHMFNTLDARGAVSATERVAVIKRVRDLAVACAHQYLEAREKLGFPLMQHA